MAGAPGRPKAELTLSDEERDTLRRWARRPKSAQALALRARVVLACADGASNTEVAARLGVNQVTVGKWRARFVERRLIGLSDEPRPGQPRKISDEQVEAVIVTTLESKPVDATHWSTRSMAAATGLNQTAISRIWRAFGLKPHLQETFKLSTDPQFVDKVRDIVGLFLNPPEAALVLCVDEKTQVQALDRSAPVLPMMPGTPERVTHDYLRAGTTDLFAALDVATGKVITQMTAQHRAAEFKAFLAEIDKQVPAQLDVHVICDNLSTHKTDAIRRWLVRHPRFHLHFIPTGSSWLNLVERWCAEITMKLIRRGVHRSVAALKDDIEQWVKLWIDDPRPYVWTKTADQILSLRATPGRRRSRGILDASEMDDAVAAILASGEKPAASAALNAAIDPAVQRYDSLDEDAQDAVDEQSEVDRVTGGALAVSELLGDGAPVRVVQHPQFQR